MSQHREVVLHMLTWQVQGPASVSAFIVPLQIPLKLTGKEGRDSLVAEGRPLLGPVTVGWVFLVLFLQSGLPSAFL